MGRQRALVSGGGIAGATLAWWLGRDGWDVTVVEHSAGLRSSGNPVDVRGDAATVAQDMGIWPDLQKVATGAEIVEVVDAAGRVRTRMPNGSGRSDNRVEVPRADLGSILAEAAGRRSEFLYGDEVASLTPSGDGVEVELAHGPGGHYDLVVGADGVHSNVRRLAFGSEAQLTRSLGMYVATVRTPTVGPDPSRIIMHNRPGTSVTLHPAGGHPVAAFIFRSRERQQRPSDAWAKSLVERTYSGQGWLVPQLVREFTAADDIYFDAVTRVSMTSWTRGHITVLGDAASCVSLLGEGSSNAITGAATLARALRSSSSVGEALATYERVHRRRISRYQRRARPMSHLLVPATAVGLALRDWGLNAVS